MKTKEPITQAQPITYIVQATDIVSSEMYRYLDETEEPVLRGISLDVKRRECWGIIGDEPFEINILMQIIANVRPYGSGRCALVERGMMRRKRRIIPHVFYISGGDSVPGNLNTLEYLMYVTDRTDIPDRDRQTYILQALLGSGLYPLTLVPLKYLKASERAVVSFLSAALSKALLVVFDVPELFFEPRLAKGIHYIVEMIKNRGGAALLGTKDCDMVQEACTHAAFLIQGQFAKCDTVESLVTALDQRAFILKTDRPIALAEAIQSSKNYLDAYVFEQEVHVYVRRNNHPLSQDSIMKILLEAGIKVESLQRSMPTLQNAYREVMAGHVI